MASAFFRRAMKPMLSENGMTVGNDPALRRVARELGDPYLAVLIRRRSSPSCTSQRSSAPRQSSDPRCTRDRVVIHLDRHASRKHRAAGVARISSFMNLFSAVSGEYPHDRKGRREASPQRTPPRRLGEAIEVVIEVQRRQRAVADEIQHHQQVADELLVRRPPGRRRPGARSAGTARPRPRSLARRDTARGVCSLATSWKPTSPIMPAAMNTPPAAHSASELGQQRHPGRRQAARRRLRRARGPARATPARRRRR